MKSQTTGLKASAVLDKIKNLPGAVLQVPRGPGQKRAIAEALGQSGMSDVELDELFDTINELVDDQRLLVSKEVLLKDHKGVRKIRLQNPVIVYAAR